MTIINAILVPTDEEKEIEVIGFQQGDYQFIQSMVGGTFQCLDIERPDATLFINDEGKLDGSELNRRGTLLLWAHDSRFRNVDALYGDVLILGRPDEEGASQSVSQQMLDLLFNTAEYRYQVQTADGPSWNGNGLRFDTWVDAYDAALGLADRWAAVKEVRVVSA